MRRRQAGFTLMEIMLVVGIIGIITAIATPMFLSYYQGAQLRVAAEQVATFLNQGRQLAITQNGSICVHISHDGNALPSGHLRGRDVDRARHRCRGQYPRARGHHALPATANVIFNYLGGSTAGATYTITHTPSSKSVNVVVALSGRVCITP